MKTIISTAATAAVALTGALGAQAQDLSKEITADREIVPELAPASRLNVFPKALKPDFKPVELAPATTATMTRYNPVTARFEPVWSGRAATLTPYRGYVDVGYFPKADFGVSAGYAPVSRDNMELDIWLNARNSQYKAGHPATWLMPQSELEGDFKMFDIAGGVSFMNRFDAGTLSVSTDIDYSRYNRALTLKDQSTLGWNLGAGWHGHAANGLDYSGAARFGLFRFGQPSRFALMPPATPDGVPEFEILQTGESGMRQTTVGLDFAASLPAGANGRFGLDLSADIVGYNHGTNYSVVSFTPHYRLNTGDFTARAGARFDININSGKTFHVAPDVMLAYEPVSQFGARLTFGGGEQVNTLRELWQLSRFVSPMYSPGPSNIPLTAELALRVTPVGGVSLEVGGAYANAHDWLIPLWMPRGLDAYGTFAGCNVHSFKAFARLTAAWRDYVDFTAEVGCRFGDRDRTDSFWYEWRDGARTVVGASLAIHPVSKLDITIGYEGRLDRRLMAMQEGIGLDWHNLSAGAGYRITPALSVFARFSNLLDRRQQEFFLYSGPRFNGLFGVGYKF